MQLFSKVLTGRRAFAALLIACSGMAVQAASAANITVASPINGSSNTTSVWIRAHNVGCSGLNPTAFGFSIDSSGSTTMGVTPYDIDVTHYSIGAGTHTVHFKSWTSAGVCPVVNSTFTVGGSSSSGASSSGGSAQSSPSASTSVPAGAAGISNIETHSGWVGEHDAGTPGWASGSMVYPSATSGYDNARKYYMTYSGRGGERWHISFANNASATHFVFDTYVYVVNPNQLANLELDLNQVMPNGQTVIYGTQCSVYSHSWEWAYYASGAFHWHSSNVGCNPLAWKANTWHHIQIGFHRDGSGVVTHDWVALDGSKSSFSGATSYSAQSLGWAKGTLLMNVQPDGYNAGSGSLTMFLHGTTYYYW